MSTRFHNGSFGVMCAKTGKRYQTKKQLREAVKEDPANVAVEDMSMFGSKGPGGQVIWTADQIPPGIGYRTIAGPDPAVNRRWYASIFKTDEGEVKVK